MNEVKQTDTISSQLPEFIPETTDILLLKQKATPILQTRKCQLGHINMAYDLLVGVLYQMYGKTDIVKCIEDSVLVNHCTKFSTIVSERMNKAGWSTSTQQTVFQVLKKMLGITAINCSMLAKIRICSSKKPVHPLLGKKYGQLAPDHPVKIRLFKWVQAIKHHTKNKSDLGVRNILNFFLNTCLPVLNIDLHNWPTTEVIQSRLSEENIRTICGDKSQNRKKHWLQLLISHVFELQHTIPSSIVLVNTKKRNSICDETDGSDKHKIPIPELEILQKEAAKNIRSELIFMLLLTTGMRVGGLTHIRTEHVASVNGSDILIRDTGRTLEKGSKWFTFMLCPKVQQLLHIWINTKRPADTSPYLFPGQFLETPISTSTVRIMFKQLCVACNLSGSHLHLHAFRHTYAHMLLKNGNKVETVSKLLGHASSKTTEQFYLIESAVEVAARANIPWLDKTNEVKQPTIPNFLSSSSSSQSSKDKSERKKKRQRRAMASLSMFSENS
jgi:integrase